MCAVTTIAALRTHTERDQNGGHCTCVLATKRVCCANYCGRLLSRSLSGHLSTALSNSRSAKAASAKALCASLLHSRCWYICWDHSIARVLLNTSSSAPCCCAGPQSCFQPCWCRTSSDCCCTKPAQSLTCYAVLCCLLGSLPKALPLSALCCDLF